MENVLLSLRHLKKTFADHVIFEDFNLDVHKGEVVVIIGPIAIISLICRI